MSTLFSRDPFVATPLGHDHPDSVTFPEPLSPVTAGHARLWNESQLFWWHDLARGHSGVHRIGHQPNNPPGLAQLWHGILTPGGERFRQCIEVDLNPAWRSSGRYRTAGLEFTYSKQGLHASYLGPNSSMELEFVNQHMPLDPSGTSLNLNTAAVSAAIRDTLFGGHIQASGRVTGVVSLAGRTFDVDALGFRDHSWGGQRDMRPFRVTHWACGTTGSDFSFSLGYAILVSGEVFKTAFVVKHGEPVAVRDFDFVIGLALDGICWRSASLILDTVDGERYQIEFAPPIDGLMFGYAEYLPFITSTKVKVGNREGVGYIEYQCNPRGGLEVPRHILRACNHDGYSRRRDEASFTLQAQPVRANGSGIDVGSFPKMLAEMSPDWLTDALIAGGALQASSFVTEYSATPLGHGNGGMVVRIVPTYSGEVGPRGVIAKFSQSNPGNRELAERLDIFRSEVMFYDTISARVTLRKPVCFGTSLSTTGDASLLLLEDFPNHRPGDQCAGCGVDDVQLCMSQLARLHAPFWGANIPNEIVTFASRHGPSVAAHSASVWDSMITRFGDLVPASVRNVREAYYKAFPNLNEWSQLAPATVIHGDFRLDNLLFGVPGTPDALVVLDWQLISWAKGAMDVAYLLTQSLDFEDRLQTEQALLKSYCDELASLGVNYAIAQCYEDYRRAALIMFSYAISITGGMNITDERTHRWMRTTLARAVASFEALELSSLL